MVGGHVIVFFSAGHVPGSIHGHLVAQARHVVDDPVIFLLCLWIESNGFTLGSEPLAAEFGDVSSGLKLRYGMQVIFLYQIKQAFESDPTHMPPASMRRPAIFAALTRPPTRSLASRTTTFLPCRISARAALNPAKPAPTTTISV